MTHLTEFSMKSIKIDEEGEMKCDKKMPFAQIQREPNAAGYKDRKNRERLLYKQQRLELGLSAIVQLGGLVQDDDMTDRELSKVELLNKWMSDLKIMMHIEDLGNSQNSSDDILKTESDDDDASSVGENNPNQQAISHEGLQMETAVEVQDDMPGQLFPHYIHSETLHDVDFVEIQCSCGRLYEIVCTGSNFFVRTNSNETVSPANGTSFDGQITIDCSCERTFIVKKTDDQLVYATHLR